MQSYARGIVVSKFTNVFILSQRARAQPKPRATPAAAQAAQAHAEAADGDAAAVAPIADETLEHCLARIVEEGQGQEGLSVTVGLDSVDNLNFPDDTDDPSQELLLGAADQKLATEMKQKEVDVCKTSIAAGLVSEAAVNAHAKVLAGWVDENGEPIADDFAVESEAELNDASILGCMVSEPLADVFERCEELAKLWRNKSDVDMAALNQWKTARKPPLGHKGQLSLVEVSEGILQYIEWKLSSDMSGRIEDVDPHHRIKPIVCVGDVRTSTILFGHCRAPGHWHLHAADRQQSSNKTSITAHVIHIASTNSK